MSQENVEFAREVWAAYEREGIDAMSASAYYADDAVAEDIPELPDGKVYSGPTGFRERYWHFVDTWGDFTIKPVEFIDGGGNEVVVTTAMAGLAPGSGLPLNAPAVFVYEVRERKIVRDRAFMSKAAALKSVGLTDG